MPQSFSIPYFIMAHLKKRSLFTKANNYPRRVVKQAVMQVEKGTELCAKKNGSIQLVLPYIGKAEEHLASKIT